jgi:hypothetical protein
MNLTKQNQLAYFENIIKSKREAEALRLKEEINQNRFQLLNR